MNDVDRELTQAGERWRAGQAAAPAVDDVWRPERGRVAGRTGGALATVLVAAVLLAGLVVLGGGRGRPDRSSLADATGSPVTASPTEPTSTPTTAIVDGLPESIDGQAVLRGDAAARALKASTDDSPMLIGGWLKAARLLSCPMVLRPDPWNPCSATRLDPSPYDGPLGLAVYRGADEPAWPIVPDGDVQPIVLRVHTHDPRCALGDACASVPVLEAIAWTAAATPIPAPTSSPPPTSFSELDAIEAAIRVGAQSSSDSTVVGAVRGHYAAVGPGGGDVAGDRWVWAVTLAGSFRAPDCSGTACPARTAEDLVVLDYVTGTFLISSTSTPGPDWFAGDAVGAANVTMKFEMARVAGAWDQGWALLGPLSRERIGSLDAFRSLGEAYNVLGGSFEITGVVAGPFDEGTTADVGAEVLGDFERAGGDPSRAFLVFVRHRDEALAAVASATYLVGPIEGGWRLWIVN
jgi:hypothetical protein